MTYCSHFNDRGDCRLSPDIYETSSNMLKLMLATKTRFHGGIFKRTPDYIVLKNLHRADASIHLYIELI